MYFSIFLPSGDMVEVSQSGILKKKKVHDLSLLCLAFFLVFRMATLLMEDRKTP